MAAGSSSVWLITGASRGIGLQLVTQRLQQHSNCTVIAAARQPESAPHLQALVKQHGNRVQLLQLDQANKDSIKAAAQWVNDKVGRLDVLINNAGVIETTSHTWEHVDPEEATQIINTNVLGPLLVASALAPLLRSSPAQHKVVANISSVMGSVGRAAEDAQPGIEAWAQYYDSGKVGEAPARPALPASRCTMYRASKAALNMETLSMARDLAPDNVAVVCIHPGWTSTDMGNRSAQQMNIPGVTPGVTPEQSAQGILSVIEKLTLKDSGSFLTWEGKTLPW